MPQLCIQENLLRIQPLVPRYCADKKVSRQRQWDPHQNQCRPPRRLGDIIKTKILLFNNFTVRSNIL